MDLCIFWKSFVMQVINKVSEQIFYLTTVKNNKLNNI